MDDQLIPKGENTPDATQGREPRSCAGADGSTVVDAVVMEITVDYVNRDVPNWQTGTMDTHFTGVTIHSMKAQEPRSGRMIENLPAPRNAKPGDTVRITVEVVNPSNSD